MEATACAGLVAVRFGCVCKLCACSAAGQWQWADLVYNNDSRHGNGGEKLAAMLMSNIVEGGGFEGRKKKAYAEQCIQWMQAVLLIHLSLLSNATGGGDGKMTYRACGCIVFSNVEKCG
uniref:Uncharacterized protein n=1 Tax=Anopheles coluzzii TaxID=1518534 RepID=A0A8W7Q1I5_ANOCL